MAINNSSTTNQSFRNSLLGGVSTGINGVASGISSGISSLLTGWIGRLQAKRNLKLQDKFAARAFEREANFAREMYTRQYNDTSPANVRKRLEDAGLNSALFFSNGSSGPGAIGSLSANGGQFPDMESLPYDTSGIGSTFSGLSSGGQDLNTTPSSDDFRDRYLKQTRLLVAQTGSEEASASLTRYEEFYKKATFSLNVQTLRQNLSNMIREGNKLLAETALSHQKFRTELQNTSLVQATARQAENALRFQYLDFVEQILRIKTQKANLTWLLPAQVQDLRSKIMLRAEQALSEGARRLLYGNLMNLNDSRSVLNNFMTKATYQRFLNSRTQGKMLKKQAAAQPIFITLDTIGRTVNIINDVTKTFDWMSPSGHFGGPQIGIDDIGALYQLGQISPYM